MEQGVAARGGGEWEVAAGGYGASLSGGGSALKLWCGLHSL